MDKVFVGKGKNKTCIKPVHFYLTVVEGDDNELISSSFILRVLPKTNLFCRMFSSFESSL